MGKGRVLAAHGEGRYTIEVVEDRARAESSRALAQQRLGDLVGITASLEQQRSAAQVTVDQAAADQNQAITQYQQEMQADGLSDIDLAGYAQAVLNAAAVRDRLQVEIRQAEIRQLALQSRIERIEALPPLRQIEAWCADYTEDLAGEVATAEVPGEAKQIVIKPGFTNRAAWLPEVDGALQPALSSTPAGAFYNLAMLPGWQKWRPTFRIATISNINNDLCDITLDAAASSQQDLNVNAQGSYAAVPIMYMDCNADAFEAGDRVLVAFSGNTEQPMVVGFEREPRECGFGFSTFDPNIFQNHEYLWPDYDVPTWQTSPFDCADIFRVKSKVRLKNIFARAARRDASSAGESWVALYRCNGIIPAELLLYGLSNDSFTVASQLVSAPEEEMIFLEPGVNYMIWICPVNNSKRVYDKYGFSLTNFHSIFGGVESILSPDEHYHEKYSFSHILNYPSPFDDFYNISEQFVLDVIGQQPTTVRRVAFGSATGVWVNFFGINYEKINWVNLIPDEA